MTINARNPLSNLKPRLAGFGRGVGAVVQDARDRRDRDARQVGDVANRRPASKTRPVPLDISLCHVSETFRNSLAERWSRSKQILA